MKNNVARFLFSTIKAIVSPVLLTVIRYSIPLNRIFLKKGNAVSDPSQKKRRRYTFAYVGVLGNLLSIDRRKCDILFFR
jgi:hypothetical protein